MYTSLFYNMYLYIHIFIITRGIYHTIPNTLMHVTMPYLTILHFIMHVHRKLNNETTSCKVGDASSLGETPFPNNIPI